MKKTYSILTALVSVLLILLIASFAYPRGGDKIAFIKLNEVYQEFSMRKEMESKYKAVESARKNLIDSIEFQAKRVQAGGDQEKYEQMLEIYIRKRRELEEANKVLSNQHDEQVWNQINSYCQDFGKENGYDFILGAEGTGSIMYANSGKDVTAEVTEYINRIYNGKQEKTKK